MSFFFSKKVFKCHICKPATDKQTKSERKLNQAILELVLRFSSCISSSLEPAPRMTQYVNIFLKINIPYPTRKSLMEKKSSLLIMKEERFYSFFTFPGDKTSLHEWKRPYPAAS